MQWRTVNHALSDPVLARAFTSGGELSPGYGVGLTERVVEYPWALSRLTELTAYRRTATGWQLATAEAVADAVYSDGAYAVACVDLRL